MAATKLVVGFDGSPGSCAALRWALAAAGADGAVEVVAVWEPVATGVNPWVPAAAFDERILRDGFRDHARSMALATAGESLIDLRFPDGHAGACVVAAAAGARCLVLGRRGHGGFAGLLLGSVADYALRHADGAVALVPGRDAPPDSGRIVVGVDGSEPSVAALRWAASEAERRDRELVVLLAWSFLEQPSALTPDYGADDARRYAAAVVARTLGERAVRLDVVNDRPAGALMDRSAAGDLVVVGGRGLGAVRGALVGSVSRQLAHHAPSTVVVVHRPD